MIQITRLDDSELMINSDMIEFIEQTPDTIITLSDGKKILTKLSPEEIINRIVEFRQRVLQPIT
ncbi:flagellar protein [bacterium BMS3Bbin04]|nr:flagellar protein [bacterium BMS3Bbin04]